MNIERLTEDVIRSDVDDGFVICKVGWNAEYKMVTEEEERPVMASAEESILMMQELVQAGQMSEEQMIAMIETAEPMQKGVEIVEVEREKLVQNHPTLEIRNPANVIVDPSAEGDLRRAQFVLEEYPISFSDLKKDEFVETTVETESTDESGAIVKTKTTTSHGIYRNLECIDHSKSEYNYDEHHSKSVQSYKMSGKSRIKLKAFEYWGFWDIHDDGTVVPIVATWVGDTIIRLEENPYTHQKIPYISASYMPVRREIAGEPDAILLEENQIAIGKTTRAIQDMMAEEAVGQEYIDETLFPSPIEKENHRTGRTVYTRSGLDPAKAIYRKNVNPISNIALQWRALQVDDAESMSGTNLNTNAGSNQSVNQQKRADSSISKREASILRRISGMFIEAARLIIPMYAEYMSDEEIIRNTNGESVALNRDAMAGEFDLRVDIQTPEVNQAIASDLSMLLQTGQQTMPPEVVMKIWARILKLKGQYDLSRTVEDFKPEPPKLDPKQEELMNMQIEEQRLKIEKAKKDIEEVDSRIHERVSRVIENEKDVENKESQNQLRQAQTQESIGRLRKLESETDEIDRKFVDEQSGNKRLRDMEDKEVDFNVKRQEKQDDAEIEMTKAEMLQKIQNLESQLSGSQTIKKQGE